MRRVEKVVVYGALLLSFFIMAFIVMSSVYAYNWSFVV